MSERAQTPHFAEDNWPLHVPGCAPSSPSMQASNESPHRGQSPCRHTHCMEQGMQNGWACREATLQASGTK